MVLYNSWPMGTPDHCKIHDLWEIILLRDPWPMGAPTTVWSMIHGCPFHCTIHDPWVPLPPYSPWPMGTPSMCHGSYDDVRHCFFHDPWCFVTIAVPMTHGKKSLNPVACPWLVSLANGSSSFFHLCYLLVLMADSCPTIMGHIICTYCCKIKVSQAEYNIQINPMAPVPRTMFQTYGNQCIYWYRKLRMCLTSVGVLNGVEE